MSHQNLCILNNISRNKGKNSCSNKPISSMSLKDSLKPCSNISIPSCSTQSQSSISILNSNLPQPPRRIPPKTSISQQLLRLDLPFSPPVKLSSNQELPVSNSIRVVESKHEDKPLFKGEKPISEGDDDDDDDNEEEGYRLQGFGRPRLEGFQLGETGPYEPLILSSDDEVPLIQVTNSLLILNFDFLDTRVSCTSVYR